MLVDAQSKENVYIVLYYPGTHSLAGDAMLDWPLQSSVKC